MPRRQNADSMRRRLTAAIALLLLALPASAADPNVSELLVNLGFDQAEKRLMLEKWLVQKDLKPASEREYATAMAFFIEVEPERLIRAVHGAGLNDLEADPFAAGTFRGFGAIEDLRSLSVAPKAPEEAEEQAERWLEATPGGDLNLSTAEIGAFAAVKVMTEGSSPVFDVELQIRQNLLDRYQAYRGKGFDGIAPYDRGDGRRADVGADLRRATETLYDLQWQAPGLYTALGGKPEDEPLDPEEGYRPDELGELFDWSRQVVEGVPVFVLSHRAFLREDEIFVWLQRHYYVSGGYDAAQGVVGLFRYHPLCEEIGPSYHRASGCPRARPREGTLLLYLGHTWSEEIAGGSDDAIRVLPMAERFKRLFTRITGRRAVPQRTSHGGPGS